MKRAQLAHAIVATIVLVGAGASFGACTGSNYTMMSPATYKAVYERPLGRQFTTPIFGPAGMMIAGRFVFDRNGALQTELALDEQTRVRAILHDGRIITTRDTLDQEAPLLSITMPGEAPARAHSVQLQGNAGAIAVRDDQQLLAVTDEHLVDIYSLPDLTLIDSLQAQPGILALAIIGNGRGDDDNTQVSAVVANDGKVFMTRLQHGTPSMLGESWRANSAVAAISPSGELAMVLHDDIGALIRTVDGTTQMTFPAPTDIVAAAIDDRGDRLVFAGCHDLIIASSAGLMSTTPLPPSLPPLDPDQASSNCSDIGGVAIDRGSDAVAVAGSSAVVYRVPAGPSSEPPASPTYAAPKGYAWDANYIAGTTITPTGIAPRPLLLFGKHTSQPAAGLTVIARDASEWHDILDDASWARAVRDRLDTLSPVSDVGDDPNRPANTASGHDERGHRFAQWKITDRSAPSSLDHYVRVVEVGADAIEIRLETHAGVDVDSLWHAATDAVYGRATVAPVAAPPGD